MVDEKAYIQTYCLSPGPLHYVSERTKQDVYAWCSLKVHDGGHKCAYCEFEWNN